MVVLVLFMLLGRSKSEQYFGFLPFFSYINFLLGYLPLVFSDVISQSIIMLYALYTFIYKTVYFLINRITTNTITSIVGGKNTYINEFNMGFNTNNDLSFKTMFSTNYINFSYEKYKMSLVSKTLSILRTDMYSINSLQTNKKNTTILTNYFNVYDLVLRAKTKPLSNSCFNSISTKESYYSGSYNSKVHNTVLTLGDLTSFYKVHNYPLVFNFNIKNNLNVANQQRWLTKNSLLTESIVNNSFLFTQVKKLIGTGSFNNSFTNQSL